MFRTGHHDSTTTTTARATTAMSNQAGVGANDAPAPIGRPARTTGSARPAVIATIVSQLSQA